MKLRHIPLRFVPPEARTCFFFFFSIHLNNIYFLLKDRRQVAFLYYALLYLTFPSIRGSASMYFMLQGYKWCVTLHRIPFHSARFLCLNNIMTSEFLPRPSNSLYIHNVSGSFYFASYSGWFTLEANALLYEPINSHRHP